MNAITETQYNAKLREGYNTIPLFIKLERTYDASLIYETFCVDPEQGGLLESGRTGKYSYVAFSPIAKIQSKNGQIHIEGDHDVSLSPDDDPLDGLMKLMNVWNAPLWPDGPDWQGGALGFLSYDLVRRFERLPDQTIDDLGIPDLLFTIYRDVIAVDHEQQTTYLITNAIADQGDDYRTAFERLLNMKIRLSHIVDREEEPSPVPGPLERPPAVNATFTKEQFMRAIEKIQDYIRSGQTLQVNLSIRQDFPLNTTPWNVYCQLRKLNPSPYMGYLHYPDYQFVCGSPELLIKIKDRKIATRPIGGTRPRGKNAAEDLALREELLHHEKERAEHVMLVDIERNDLGKVCKYGSVRVTDFMVIEEYSHVMHIVSNIEGELEADKTIYDAIRAAFPGGTITGAPKIRTMEIIEELEPVKRGLYTGSIGWIGFNGDLQLNIVIRTLIAANRRAYVQAGAGVVIDSEAEAEYYESLKKAEALLKSVELSEKAMMS